MMSCFVQPIHDEDLLFTRLLIWLWCDCEFDRYEFLPVLF